jgi:predicted ATPase
VTSREPLGVIGETLYQVLPLALPAVELASDEIGQVDSVRLFVVRARSILPTFDLTPDNAEIVAKICRDLDGIPLAIELASARVNILSVQQILTHLEHRLDLLVSTSRAMRVTAHCAPRLTGVTISFPRRSGWCFNGSRFLLLASRSTRRISVCR